MDSAHAIRLYELLCQWRDAGEREVTIEWLREAFQLDGKYPAIKDFKKRVIEPAVEQINELTPLWVKWDQRKTGRRVSHLLFTFGKKPSEKAAKARKAKASGNAKGKDKSASGAIYGIPRAIIEAKARAGESYEDAALRLLNEAKTRESHS
jgi:plasmid replication initiation protein